MLVLTLFLYLFFLKLFLLILFFLLCFLLFVVMHSEHVIVLDAKL